MLPQRTTLRQVMDGLNYMTCPKHGTCRADCQSECAPKTEAERKERIAAHYVRPSPPPEPPPPAAVEPRRRLDKRLFGMF